MKIFEGVGDIHHFPEYSSPLKPSTNLSRYLSRSAFVYFLLYKNKRVPELNGPIGQSVLEAFERKFSAMQEDTQVP